MTEDRPGAEQPLLPFERSAGHDPLGQAGQFDGAGSRAGVAGAHGARETKPLPEVQRGEGVGGLMEALDRLVQPSSPGGRRGQVAG
jgi:hypothetical protein